MGVEDVDMGGEEERVRTRGGERVGEEREESGFKGVDPIQVEVFEGLRARTLLPPAKQGLNHLDRLLNLGKGVEKEEDDTGEYREGRGSGGRGMSN